MGPATILCHLIGPETFLLGFLENPSKIKRLLNSLSGVCIQMGNALAGAGADVLQFPDPIASSDILSPTLFEEFCLPCYQRIFEEIKCPVVLHICGNSGPILSMIEKSGAIGFSFDAKVSVSDARAVIGIAMSLVGNISTTNLLDGSAEEVKRESIQAIRDGIDILAPSCGFPPGPLLKMSGK